MRFQPASACPIQLPMTVSGQMPESHGYSTGTGGMWYVFQPPRDTTITMAIRNGYDAKCNGLSDVFCGVANNGITAADSTTIVGALENDRGSAAAFVHNTPTLHDLASASAVVRQAWGSPMYVNLFGAVPRTLARGSARARPSAQQHERYLSAGGQRRLIMEIRGIQQPRRVYMKVKYRLVAAMMAVAVTSIVGVSAASANGPCGVDYNGPTACGVNAPAAINGTIVQGQESDYYVFWAPAGTQIAATITNQIAPSCSNSNNYCGKLSMYLAGSDGEPLEDNGSYSSPSEYSNGVLLTGQLVDTLTQTGTYYLIVNGESALEGNGSPVPTAYGLSVTANSGAIQWPAPPPPPPPAPKPIPAPAPKPVPAPLPAPKPKCVIPHAYGVQYNVVRHRLAVNHCRSGRVYLTPHTGKRRGVVLALGFRGYGHRLGVIWRAGLELPYGSTVDLKVSAGR